MSLSLTLIGRDLILSLIAEVEFKEDSTEVEEVLPSIGFIALVSDAEGALTMSIFLAETSLR